MLDDLIALIKFGAIVIFSVLAVFGIPASLFAIFQAKDYKTRRTSAFLAIGSAAYLWLVWGGHHETEHRPAAREEQAGTSPTGAPYAEERQGQSARERAEASIKAINPMEIAQSSNLTPARESNEVAIAPPGCQVESVEFGRLSPTSRILQARVSLNAPVESLTRDYIESTLRELLKSLRSWSEKQGGEVDTVTAYLYTSSAHFKNGSDAIARGVTAPATTAGQYRETISIWSIPAAPVASSVTRLAVETRKQVYYELMEAVDRAHRETSAQYGGISVVSVKADDILIEKYQGQVKERYEISDAEGWAIIKEATAQNWLAPPR